MPITEVLRITREIAAGLVAAHSAGLTHRDIKPANIWLEKSGRVKILDFGLARPEHDDAHLTQTGSIAGTPQYMAPEQAAGQPVDHLSDLFSLGCVLYRLLTGRLPFRGPNAMAILTSLALEQPPPPQESRPEVPRALSDLTMRLLAKKPSSRPQSAEAVVAELAAIEKVAGTLRLPLPDGGTRSVPTTLARRRGILVAAAVLLLVAAPVAAWYAPTVYRIATNQGLLVIQTDDPDVEVTVKQDGELVQIVDRKTGQELTLKAGTYQLELSGKKKDGLKLQTNQFTLTRGDKEIVKVWRKPPATNPAPAVESSPPDRLPFVVLPRGELGAQKFATLADAAAAAKGGDTIEIRGHGPFETPAIDLGSRALVIRAGEGFEPVLQIDAKSLAADLPLIKTEGPLVLEGLHFQHVEQAPDKASRYYYFIASKRAPFAAAHCRFLLKSNRNLFALYLFKSPRAEVRHCEFGGSFLNAINWWCAPPSNQLDVSNCLSWGANTFLISGHNSEELPQNSSLCLHRNTFVGFRSIQHYYDRLPDVAPVSGSPPYRIEARENMFNADGLLGIVQLDPEKFQPDVDQPRLPHLMAWSEHKNLCTGMPLRFGWVGKSVDAIQSLEDWQAFWGLEDTGCLKGFASYQGGDVWTRKTAEPEKLTPADFRMHADCPGKGAGENGRDLGADVDLVGPGPAYDYWRKTPKYQEWLKSTAGQP